MSRSVGEPLALCTPQSPLGSFLVVNPSAIHTITPTTMGFLRVNAPQCRSPPYRLRDSPEGRDAFGGSRNGNRRAGFATRERESRGRIVAPFRLAKPSAMAPSGALAPDDEPNTGSRVSLPRLGSFPSICVPNISIIQRNSVVEIRVVPWDIF